jgi:DNA-binding MarR family transcriptional regulator
MATRIAPGVLSTEDGLKYFSPERESAFFGLLQTHVEIIRALEHELAARHGVSLAGYEVLNRVGRAPDGGLRMSDLADRTRLSLSRISRVVDDLVLRGWAERRPCATDRRVSYVGLTEAGGSLLREAQETFYDTVEERFLGRLSAEETRVLGDVFARLAARGEDCQTALG